MFYPNYSSIVPLFSVDVFEKYSKYLSVTMFVFLGTNFLSMLRKVMRPFVRSKGDISTVTSQGAVKAISKLRGRKKDSRGW